MEKYESRSTKIHFYGEDQFWNKFNNLGVVADMPNSIKDDIPDITSTSIRARIIFYYVRI